MKKAAKGIHLLSKTTAYFTSNILTDYLQVVYKTTFGLQWRVYDQLSNNAFSNKLETAQYNATLAITGAIKGTSRKKLYQELGLEYL